MEMILILSTLFGSISLITGRDTPAYNAITYPALGSNECSHGEEVDGVKWICDPDNIFKLHELQQLSNIAEQIQRETTCPCSDAICSSDNSGYVVMVATMKRIYEGPEGYEKGINAARTFTNVLLEEWEVPDIRCSEEILVVYVERDNNPLLYTVTGQVAKGKLPNHLLTRFSLDNMGRFVSNSTSDKFLGMKNLLEQYNETLRGRNVYPTRNPQPEAVVGGETRLLPTLVILVTSLFFWLTIGRHM